MNSFSFSILCLVLLFMHKGATQNVGIGVSNPSSPLHIVADVDGIAVRIQNHHPINLAIPNGLYVSIRGEFGMGTIARAENQNCIAAPVPIMSYTISGTVGDGRKAIGAFATNGTPLRAVAGANGLALNTNEVFKLNGIGESAGKLITSDGIGNATWQNPAKITLDQSSSSGQSAVEFRNQGVYVGGFGWSQASTRYFLYDALYVEAIREIVTRIERLEKS